MDPKQRAELIREGNAAFNSKNYDKAKKIFIETNYKDGLIRLGDYYMYDRKLPMLAYSYYKKAGYTQKLDEIFQRMIYALGELLGRGIYKGIESPSRPDLNPDDFVVHPTLKAKAIEILKKTEAT